MSIKRGNHNSSSFQWSQCKVSESLGTTECDSIVQAAESKLSGKGGMKIGPRVADGCSLGPSPQSAQLVTFPHWAHQPGAQEGGLSVVIP